MTEHSQQGAVSTEVVAGANDLAYPALDTSQTPNGTTQLGLTKRELFAAMAMQGLVVHIENAEKASSTIASIAVHVADALLKELAK